MPVHFFHTVITINETIPSNVTPRTAFGISETSFAALVDHAYGWSEDDRIAQRSLSQELCEQARTINSRTQLAAAMNNVEKLAVTRKI